MEPPAPPRIFDGNVNPIDNRGMSSKDMPHKVPPAGGDVQISPLNCPSDTGSALPPIVQGAHLAQRQPGMYAMVHGQVMTDKQLDTLRRQISVYSTICKQLVEMHKAMVAQQNSLSGLRLGQSVPYDPAVHAVGQKFASRQRWTPSQTQIQFLEKLFEQGSGTPTKQRIKEITQELSQYGPISETNVYNWFQNRRARSKRKQQVGGHNNGESEFDTDGDSPEEKRAKLERDLSNESFGAGPVELNHQSGDSGEHQQFDMQKGPQTSSFQQLEASKGPETSMIHIQRDHASFSANRAHKDDHGFAPSSMAGSFPLMSFRAWDAAAHTQDAKTGHVATSMPQQFSATGKNEQR